MPNPKTGNLLLNIVESSKKIPSKVMLGHISSQRNERNIALKETIRTFEKAGKKMDFQLHAAPLRESCDVVQIA